MDELEIKGKKYISSKRASELTGYAKDYVGQLARAGKIPGSRVGRAWYVEEEALLHMRIDTPVASFSGVIGERKPIVSPLQPRPRISPITLKAIGYRRGLPETWSPARYFQDDADLLPLVSKEDSNRPEIVAMPKHHIPVRIMVMPRAPLPLPVAPRGTISKKAKEIRRKRHFQGVVLSFGAVTAALGVLLFFSSGFVLSSHFEISESNGAYTANVVAGFEYVRDTLMKFPPFAEGVISLNSFLSLMFHSFYGFFAKGVSFLWLVIKSMASLV